MTKPGGRWFDNVAGYRYNLLWPGRARWTANLESSDAYRPGHFLPPAVHPSMPWASTPRKARTGPQSLEERPGPRVDPSSPPIEKAASGESKNAKRVVTGPIPLVGS